MNKKILVVDSDVSLLDFLSKLLSFAGFKVFTANDGSGVLEMSKLVKPDLLLLDLVLPNTDGIQVCSSIRETCNLPIVFLSAKNEVQDRIMAFACGCDDFIGKPFDSTELLLRIKAVLKRSYKATESKPETVIKAKDISIDRITRIVMKGNKVIELTAKEFELLWLLISHPQQVFTRDQLIYQIWNSDFCGDTAAVKMLVKRLREKIEDSAATPNYIKTVRGVGYKFDT